MNKKAKLLMLYKALKNIYISVFNVFNVFFYVLCSCCIFVIIMSSVQEKKFFFFISKFIFKESRDQTKEQQMKL